MTMHMHGWVAKIGHYFREMEGQHMAGIDVVHHQIVPIYTTGSSMDCRDRDGEFFHFDWPKLEARQLIFRKKKRPCAVCEIFRKLSGWAEGNSFMKWLTNHGVS